MRFSRAFFVIFLSLSSLLLSRAGLLFSSLLTTSAQAESFAHLSSICGQQIDSEHLESLQGQSNFLNSIQGQWRDTLNGTVIENDGSLHQEGFEIDSRERQFSLGTARVEMAGGSWKANDFKIATFNRRTQSKLVAVCKEDPSGARDLVIQDGENANACERITVRLVVLDSGELGLEVHGTPLAKIENRERNLQSGDLNTRLFTH